MAKSFFDDEEPLTPQLAYSLSGSKVETKNKIRKTVLIILTFLVCTIAVGYFFFKIIKAPKSYKGQDVSQSLTPSSNEAIINSYLNLEPIVVNLLSPNNKQSYVRLTLTLQLYSNQESQKVEAKLPIIIDTIQCFLRELRVDDFNGSGNTLLLKEELLKRVNKITFPLVVNDILFREILIN